MKLVLSTIIYRFYGQGEHVLTSEEDFRDFRWILGPGSGILCENGAISRLFAYSSQDTGRIRLTWHMEQGFMTLKRFLATLKFSQFF